MSEDKIKIVIAAPPTFSVMDYVREVQERAYVNSIDFMFNELLADLPVVMKKYNNDMVAKAMLAHNYGEMLAKDFRQWVRNQMDESVMLPDAGASCVEYDEVPWEDIGRDLL